MGYQTRRFITEAERQKIFERWFAGESQYSIAHSLGVVTRPFRAYFHELAASDHDLANVPSELCRWLSVKRYHAVLFVGDHCVGSRRR